MKKAKIVDSSSGEIEEATTSEYPASSADEDCSNRYSTRSENDRSSGTESPDCNMIVISHYD